jgi:1,4-alpha-glucan branching enzyme
LTYLEEELVNYVKETGSHMSNLCQWNIHMILLGYQLVGYFAYFRFGKPQDFMVLVDKLHQAGIGVILDWVPSIFDALDFF